MPDDALESTLLQGLTRSSICCPHMQDYNEQVLTQLTIPNVEANLGLWEQAGGRSGARYYAGKPPQDRGQDVL
jgi:hypothetical protein